MSLMKRNPDADLTFWRNPFPMNSALQSMQRDMNRIFDQFFRGDVADTGSILVQWSPSVDILERDDAYVMKAELPVMSREDIKIRFENNVITFSGEKKYDQEKKEGNYHRIERSYGKFERSFTLPATIRQEKIDARFENGILTLTLPKTEEAKTKVVDVKIS